MKITMAPIANGNQNQKIDSRDSHSIDDLVLLVF